MRKRLMTIVILVCLLFTSCGNAEQKMGEMAPEIQTSAETSEQAPDIEKKTLKLAVSMADMLLKELVKNFNEQSEEYEVIICERPEDEYWEDYEAQLQAEIIGGNGPDLLESGLLDYTDKELIDHIQDLTKEFKGQKKKVLEAAWQNSVLDGKLCTIPYAFHINTLVAKEDVVGTRTSWTLAELMEITRESDAHVFSNNMPGSYIFFLLGIRNESNKRLIDWEKGVCNLNGKEAAELLAFAKEYAGEASFQIGDTEKYMSGEMLVQWSWISDLQSLEHDDAFYRAFETEKIYIGFPVENGESGHLMLCNDIAVNQACEYPEGAVEFLKYLISEEAQGMIVERQSELLCDMPVRKDSLEEMYDKAMEGYYNRESRSTFYIEKKETYITTKPMKQESIEKLWEVIEKAQPDSKRTDAIFQMVGDETEGYFAGEKSAKEALDSLQERVQAYLDNMK